MVKRILTVFICVLTGMASFLTLSNREDGILADENRRMSPPPSLNEFSSQDVKAFFHDVDRYYLDRVPCRNCFMELASFFPKQENYDMPYSGKKNWLFLGNKYEQCVDYLIGKKKLKEREIDRRISLFAKIQAEVQQRGAYFALIVGPNKSSVYPEYLPDAIIPANERNMSRLVVAARDRGVHVFDPTASLISHKKEAVLYWRTDSHWNNYGCYLAIDAAMKYFHLPFLPPCAGVEDHGVHRGDLLGIRPDLGANLTLSCDDNLYPVWEGEMESLPVPGNVLVIGDSFSETPVSYLEKVYTKVHRIHYMQIPKKLGEPLHESVGKYIDSLGFKPDIVLWIQVERVFAEYP